MALNQSYGTGGSVNNAQSMSQTMGTDASLRAINTTGATNASAYNAWREAAEYNAEQARIQREWQERMANTVYQRTVEDMKKAGINPVLAAGMGLGTASVSGGSAASISPSQVYNAQTFADSMSASQSSGSSWNNSESGLITFANALTELGKSLFDNLTSSQTINIAIDTLEKTAEATSKKGNPTATEMNKDNYGYQYDNDNSILGKIKQSIAKAIRGKYETTGGF